MKKIIYSGTDIDGRNRNGFVEAESNKEALTILNDMGILNITLHDEGLTAFQRDDLDGLSDKELARIAKLEIDFRNKPNVITFLIGVFKTNTYIILFGIGVFIWGFTDSSKIYMFIGGLLALSMPVLSLWNYRVVNNYDKLMRNSARGLWSEALLNISKLRPHLKQPEMAFDLDLREASIIAVENSLKEGLEFVDKWKVHFDEQSPGLYESRIATLYHVVGDYPGFVNKMRDGYLKSSESSVMITDLALAEARLGDIEKADSLLTEINIEELPLHGLSYINWIKGMIAIRRNDLGAVDYLSSAVSGMLEIADNPAVWTSLAVCSGAYALALNDSGEKDKAKALIEEIWEILKVHGDRNLLKEISENIPGTRT